MCCVRCPSFPTHSGSSGHLLESLSFVFQPFPWKARESALQIYSGSLLSTASAGKDLNISGLEGPAHCVIRSGHLSGEGPSPVRCQGRICRIRCSPHSSIELKTVAWPSRCKFSLIWSHHWLLMARPIHQEAYLHIPTYRYTHLYKHIHP